jgi:TonB-linked SusC/RagA family outer membrane protein
LLNAIRIPSYLPVYDQTNLGGYSRVTTTNDHNDAPNPVAELMKNEHNLHDLRLLGNIYGEINILKELKFRTNLSTDIRRRDAYHWTDEYANGNFDYPLALAEDFSWDNVFIFENVLSFTKQIDQHDFMVLAGNSISKSEGRYYSMNASDFTNDELRILPVGGGIIDNSATGARHSSKLGYFTRLNYTYANKYLFQANFRADASYNFAPSNRWGYFPAFSLGWKLSEESFIKDNSDFISMLKIRLGWGKSGNDLIDPYGYSPQISTFYPDYIFGETPITGSTIISLWNPDITWETSTTSNVGLDLSVLNSQLQITADYYIKNTDNILVEYPMPSSTGIGLAYGNNGSAYRNAASVRNMGFELTANYRKIISGDFTYNIGANVTFIKNEVTGLGDGLPIHDGSMEGQSVTITEEGIPIGSFYGFKVDKVYSTQAEVDSDSQNAVNIHGEGAKYQENAQAGDIRFVDINGDGWITDIDKTTIGNPFPDLVFGLTMGASYKGLDLSANFNGVYGNEIFNSQQFWTEGMVNTFNASAKVIDRWQNEGDITDIPRAISIDPNQNTRVSNRYVHDGSYIRLKTVTLGYTMPKDLISSLSYNTLTDIRVYFTLQNLFTLTKYPGFEPEINNGSNLAQGIDGGQFPQSKLFLFGIQIKF